MRGNTGALIVLGFDATVEQICSGGFALDVPFSATRLRELAKMDGAIVVDRSCERILRAAVQLVPDPGLPTQESGTRHRTAERVARQTGFPVITVSKSMRTIAVFAAGERYVLEDSAALLIRAHQALATLERYKRRLDDATGALTALEIEDRATAGDVAIVAQRLEMVGRITDEISGYLLELGTDGGLLGLQAAELTAGLRQERASLLRDYAAAAGDTDPDPPGAGTGIAGVSPVRPASPLNAGFADGDPDHRLGQLSSDGLLDLPTVAQAIGLGRAGDLELPVRPLGYRLLGHVPRLPKDAADQLIDQFGGLQKLLSASAQDIGRVPGLDPAEARVVREGLARIAESALLERYS